LNLALGKGSIFPFILKQVLHAKQTKKSYFI